MKVNVNLKGLEIEKEIHITSKTEGKFNRQGMPIYEVFSVEGKVYFDKDQFTKLCLETVKKEYEALIFDVDLEFNCEMLVTCQNGFTWKIDVFGNPKEDDNENVYFEYFEVV